MADRSWYILEHESYEHALSQTHRDRDPWGGVDCGWVEQMRLFLPKFSNPQDVVLDPFAGFGTTLVACALDGRRGIGIEFDAERIKIITERVAPLVGEGIETTVLQGDAQFVDLAPNSVDLCLTSIPYWGGMQARGNRLPPGPLNATTSYAEYLGKLDAVFRMVWRSLKKDSFFVAMAENVRSADGQMVPLAWDIGRLIARRYRLQDERVICYQEARPERGGKPDFPGWSDRTHEYALVAQKKRYRLDISAALEAIHQLKNSGIRFLLIGSLASKMDGCDTIDGWPADCDLIIQNNSATLEKVITVLSSLGFDIWSWNEQITLPIDMDCLAGRFYLRAEKMTNGDPLIIDATYETGNLTFEELWRDRHESQGFEIASKQHQRLGR